MKKQFSNLLPCSISFIFGLSILLGSCSDSKKSATPTYSAKIQKIVPDSIIKSLTAKGMNLNPGANPPSVVGIYLASPYTLLANYGPEDGWKSGKVIPDYRYKLYEQKGDEVKIDYKNTGTDTGSGIGGFLSGSDKKFSLFAELSGTASGIPYKHLTVISGEIEGSGIKNFQYAFVMKDKTGDESNSILIATGKSRIWIDGDSLASKVETFRQAFLENQGLVESVGGIK
jgi:hypothetical protein